MPPCNLPPVVSPFFFFFFLIIIKNSPVLGSFYVWHVLVFHMLYRTIHTSLQARTKVSHNRHDDTSRLARSRSVHAQIGHHLHLHAILNLDFIWTSPGPGPDLVGPYFDIILDLTSLDGPHCSISSASVRT